VPDTSIPGQNELVRQFYGQLDKDALIIDERWNGGGQVPTRFIELLDRPIANYWAIRDRDAVFPWPPDAHQGPKCMLINGLAGSGETTSRSGSAGRVSASSSVRGPGEVSSG